MKIPNIFLCQQKIQKHTKELYRVRRQITGRRHDGTVGRSYSERHMTADRAGLWVEV